MAGRIRIFSGYAALQFGVIGALKISSGILSQPREKDLFQTLPAIGRRILPRIMAESSQPILSQDVREL
jgi:hypothetical protein